MLIGVCDFDKAHRRNRDISRLLGKKKVQSRCNCIRVGESERYAVIRIRSERDKMLIIVNLKR
jgi:hypothetical protein